MWRRVFQGILFLAGLVACAAVATAPAMASDDWNLTIFHTNDMHGAFLPQPATWRDDEAEVGGMVALAWHLAEQRQTAPADLLLDAGDFMTGNPICDIADGGVQGAGFVAMMNALGYDAGVIGNHEFDLGRANARALAARATFPLLAADILNEQGEYEFPHKPLILARGGLKIGVMGISCTGLFRVTSASRTGGLSLRKQVTVVLEMIQELDPQTDLLVLITHNGVTGDKALARQLAGSGLDIIVGGHSHTRLKQPLEVEGIIIVQAGSKRKNLGRLNLLVQDDRVVAYDGRLISLTADGATAPSELTTLVAEYERRVLGEFGEVIGKLEGDWRRDGRKESNIGNYLCDRLRERADADVAFLNSGGIRKNLPAGPITILDVKEILPFANNLVTFDVTGAELMTLLQENARAALRGSHGILQVSGLRYVYRQVGDHVEVSEVGVGGKPLRKEKVYKVAAPDYVVSKADVYFGWQPPPEVNDLGVSLADVIIAAIVVDGNIRAEVDGRIGALGDRRTAEER